MTIQETIKSLTAEKANTYAKQGLLGLDELSYWCDIANKNHLSIDWQVVSDYHLRAGKKFIYYQVVILPKVLNDIDC